MTCAHLVGNIIPHSWYKIFKTTCSKPDLTAITILSEVFFKYRLNESKIYKWQVSYRYFENKFNFSKNQIRSALIRLEALNIVSREIVTEVINNNKYGGILKLVFHSDNLSKLQENFFCNEVTKLHTPPLKKTEPNKELYKNNNRSINFSLNKDDIALLNQKTNTHYTLSSCEELLQQLFNKYPNLSFTSKTNLLTYLEKTLNSKTCLHIDKLSLEKINNKT